MVYCDSNLVVRLYVEMPGSQPALEAFGKHRTRRGSSVPITWLHQIEVANAIEQMLFLARNGTGINLTSEQAAVSLAQFEEDLAARNGFNSAALNSADLVRHARQLSERHTSKHGFRTYDLIHVSSALLLKCTAFWSFDAKASKLAHLAGLKVL